MSLDLFDLTGKRALVTGSSRGIGFALARGLAAAGAQIILNGRDAARLKAAAATLGAKHVLAFDATDHEQSGVRSGLYIGQERDGTRPADQPYSRS